MRPTLERSVPALGQDVSAVQGGAASLTDLERQHSGPLAEVSGDATPSGLQHGWRRALWNAEAVRDARRLSMVEHLGVPEVGLGIEATGCVKKRASGGRHGPAV